MLTYVLFMLVIQGHFPQFADRAGVGSVTSAPKYCRSKSASSPKIVIKIYSKIRRKDILLSRLRTWLAFQKHLHCAFGGIF